MQKNAIRVFRCRHGSCCKLSTVEMIKYFNLKNKRTKCPFCGFNEFTNSGKIGLWEEITTLLRHYYAVYKLDKREKKNETVEK